MLRILTRSGAGPLNLQQLRYLCAIVDHGLNVSDAAAALFTSQPGVSKQVRQLEDELGVRVFVRIGKRIASVTPAGEAVIATARRALGAAEAAALYDQDVEKQAKQLGLPNW